MVVVHLLQLHLSSLLTLVKFDRVTRNGNDTGPSPSILVANKVIKIFLDWEQNDNNVANKWQQMPSWQVFVMIVAEPQMLPDIASV